MAIMSLQTFQQQEISYLVGWHRGHLPQLFKEAHRFNLHHGTLILQQMPHGHLAGPLHTPTMQLG
jgi:hypothetical protein